MIDWKDPQAKITEHFTVKDALWLPSWQVFHTPSELETIRICNTAEYLEKVRVFLDRPIYVHCWIRPVVVRTSGPYSGRNYNAAQSGAFNSAHITGDAVDWHAHSTTCDEIRYLLEPKLKDFGIRMEDRPGSNWVHIDTRQVLPGGRAFFKP